MDIFTFYGGLIELSKLGNGDTCDRYTFTIGDDGQ